MEPDNRLLRQLARCALEYHCFAGKEHFLPTVGTAPAHLAVLQRPVPGLPVLAAGRKGGLLRLAGPPGLRAQPAGDRFISHSPSAECAFAHRQLRAGLRGRAAAAVGDHREGHQTYPEADRQGHHQPEHQRLQPAEDQRPWPGPGWIRCGSA